MKIVRFSKKLLCAVLISCMLASSPLCAYLDTQNVHEVNASSVVGTTALLEVLLAVFGVTVSAVALDNLADSFSDWLSDNGSAESLSAWGKASSMSLVTVTAPLLKDVATWLGEKFDNLNSGSVSTAEFSSVYKHGSLSGFHSHSYDYALSSPHYDFSSKKYYMVQSVPDVVGDYIAGKLYIYACNDLHYLIKTDSGWQVFTAYNPDTHIFNGRDGLTISTIANHGTPVSAQLYCFPSSLSYSGNVGYSIFESEIDDSLYLETNYPVIYTKGISDLGSSVSFNDLAPYITATYNMDGIVSDALTSYGNYDSSNVDTLKNMILTPSIISSIMSAVKGAVASNKTEDEEGNVVWSDAIAQAISDAYAAGLADAKAQQGQLEDDVKEEERTTAITGWLSKIYDGILAIPSLVVNAWQGSWLNDILDGIVEFMQSILTGILSIPSAIVDAWEGSWLQDRLEHTVIFLEDILDGILSIPSAVVDAWENSWLKERLDRTVLFLEDISSNVRDIAQSLTQESSPDDFTVSLSSLFPFCIPFDLYDMLSVLCAEPQAPRFEWRFPNGSGETESLTIDLSKFDSVAQIVRAMEIIFFSVGLALKTRDLIRG